MVKRMVIGVVLVAVLVIVVGLYCCLVVASRADDAMERRRPE